MPKRKAAAKPGKDESSHALSRAVLGNCEEVAALFASLSHPTRLRILCLLLTGEQRVSALTEFCEISQPAMSQFLNRMKREGLLVSRREGTVIYYSIRDPRLIRLLSSTRDLYVGG